MPPSPKTAQFREEVVTRMGKWRFWKSFHTWTFLLLGALSSAVSTVVAVNTKNPLPFLGSDWAWILATVAAVLTFIISALGAQAESKSFETGARLLEGGIAKYDSRDDYGDRELGDCLADAISTLNRKS
jgi:hypothetical protein